ncbi:MAG: hypothetical protein IPN22_04310 [Bacteroidetes bacterium]|nr:hypothetical protein [Bacteroidota bacterium]
MKQTYLLTLLCSLLALRAAAQDCSSLHIDQSDLCYVKKFLIHSPQHDSLQESYLTYTKGLNEYHPKAQQAPWGGNYMPLLQGGLATRWTQTPSSHPHSDSLLSWAQVQQMSIAEIAALSPAEKMDIYLGYSDFRITRNELLHRGPERLLIRNVVVESGVARPDTVRVQAREGFCDGMRLAGAWLPEPERTITVQSYDTSSDIYVRFYPADLKALAAASCFYAQWYASVGENNSRMPDAGTFDILLREVLGRQKRTFFVDVKQGEEKWNESVVGYKREVLKESTVTALLTGMPPATKKAVDVRLTLHLLGELPLNNNATAAGIANKTLTKTRITQYRLYVDQNNRIVGGKWQKLDTQNYSNYLQYPDYIWLAGGVGVDQQPMYATQGGNPHLSYFEVQNLIQFARR